MAGVPTNRERIISYLQSISPRDASNSEIRSHTGVRPHPQVFAITESLFREGLAKRVLDGREWRYRLTVADPLLSLRPEGVSANIELSVKSAERDIAETIFTDGEAQYCERIREKVTLVKSVLNEGSLADEPNARAWFQYITRIKDTLGNINNDLSFLATLLAKEYLQQRFGIKAFDAAAKAQGAPGADIEAVAADGSPICAEIKTTRPYQPGFGAAQKSSIMTDLAKLAASPAKHKLMMVTDADAYAALCKAYYSTC